MIAEIEKVGDIVDSLKGTLISIVIFFLFIIPVLLDTISMGIVSSQLNKVGADMIQIVGSSSEYDSRVERAIELADEKYSVEVRLGELDMDSETFIEHEPGKEYEIGDEIDIALKKNITRITPMTGCDEDTGKEGCNNDFETFESIMVTKRSSD